MILYQNKWCKIVSKDTFYIVQSKQGNYNDQYFLTSSEAYKSIGINPPEQHFSFKPIK